MWVYQCDAEVFQSRMKKTEKYSEKLRNRNTLVQVE